MRRFIAIFTIAVLAYGGYLFGKPYLMSHFLKSQMQGLAEKADLKTDREIITELVAFAQERHLPVNRRDFEIIRHDGRTRIKVSYDQVVEVPGIKREYRFNLDVIS